MTIRTVPETTRSVTSTVTDATQPEPSPWPGPFPPSPPNTRAVDAVHLAAEIEVRLKEQGTPPGARYDRKATLRAVQALLAAMDIPEADDPLAIARLVARRSVALAGAR